MSSFKILGGNPLNGSIIPQGSKNEALEVISATLLTNSNVTIHNIPNIIDVRVMLNLLMSFGVEIKDLGNGSYDFNASKVTEKKIYDLDILREYLPKNRGNIMVAGPLLARFGKSIIFKPGGDKIGKRNIDIHIFGMIEIGAFLNYDEKNGCYILEAKKLIGKRMLLDEASVTGTANIIMAASLAQGTTVIYNAACEPHIQQLCKMLVQMGAKIEGIGSNLVTIHGVRELNGTIHSVMPEELEIGSFIGLAAVTMSDITIKNSYSPKLEPITRVFKKLGINVETKGNDLIVKPQEEYVIEKNLGGVIATVSDAIWPGFPADLISIALITAVQANGTTLIHQKMYESRLFFVDRLIEMGAQIILCDPHRALVVGINRSYSLSAIKMSSPDIRAGIALLIAALSANGTSIIENIEQIDRGYERIDERLRLLGASIERLN